MLRSSVGSESDGQKKRVGVIKTGERKQQRGGSQTGECISPYPAGLLGLDSLELNPSEQPLSGLGLSGRAPSAARHASFTWNSLTAGGGAYLLVKANVICEFSGQEAVLPACQAHSVLPLVRIQHWVLSVCALIGQEDKLWSVYLYVQDDITHLSKVQLTVPFRAGATKQHQTHEELPAVTQWFNPSLHAKYNWARY